MDIDKKRRQQKIRLIVTEVIMVLTVVVVVGVLFAIVTGWRVNQDFSIEQYGQVDIRSYPTGAKILVDGETQVFAQTNTSRMLTEGEHKVKLEKEGFDSWEKVVSVIPGWAIRLRYPRLFRQSREAEVVREVGDSDFLTVAPNRESILYGNKGGAWKWMSIRGDEARVTEVDLTKVVGSGIIKRIWAWGSEKVLVLTEEGEWTVVNLAQPKNSVKLGKYDKVAFMNGAGSKVWALKEGILYTIEVGANNGVRKMMEEVIDFAADENEVVYVSKKGEAGVYREGDEGGVTLGTAGEGAKVAISSYAGEKFVGVLEGQKMQIFRMDRYPTYETDNEEIKMILEMNLSMESEEVGVSWNGEFFVVRETEKLAVFDAELVEYTEYDYPKGEVWWLDDYMLSATVEEALIVRDFDGTNVRTLVPSRVSDFPAVVSANNKWLYYVSEGKIMREQVN